MPPSHLILCRSLLLLPSICPSIRVFSNELALHIRWPKYWSINFSFSISPSNEYSGLISFRIDWLDLLAVQGTLKSILQHHSSKASVLWHSVFSWSNFSHPYMTTGKTIALTRWTFVGKVMCLPFNMLSRLNIDFLPRSKCFLISWHSQHLQWFWSHEIKRRLLLRRKPMTNHRILSRDITLPTKVFLVKAMVFPVVVYGCEGWTMKKAEYWRIDAFELCCWRRLLRVPWTARRSNQSILKKISP